MRQKVQRRPSHSCQRVSLPRSVCLCVRMCVNLPTKQTTSLKTKVRFLQNKNEIPMSVGRHRKKGPRHVETRLYRFLLSGPRDLLLQTGGEYTVEGEGSQSKFPGSEIVAQSKMNLRRR